MSAPERERFIVEAYRLSRAAPQAWKEFEDAFAAYTGKNVEDAIRTPPTNALTAHGVAQAYLALRDDLRQIEQLFVAVQRKSKP